MSYTNNIPQATDQLSTSQPQILANFGAIDSGTTGTGIGFARNHITMTDATNGGLHYRVDYQAAVTSPTISGFVSSLYPFTVTDVELYYKNAVKDIPITNSLLTASSGQGMLPGGLQIRCGQASGINNGSVIAFSPAFPTACLAVSLTNRQSGAGGRVFSADSATTSQVTVNIATGGAGNANLYWIAIGY